MLKKIKNLFIKKIFRPRFAILSQKKSFVVNITKLFYIAFHNFYRHNSSLRASALTYFSLMAIVPFFALIFVVAKNVGYQENVANELLIRFEEYKEMILKIFEFADNLIYAAKSSLIALIGIIFLFWSFIKVFSNLESSLNEIWQNRILRNFKRRLSNYLAFMFVMPIFLVFFISLKIYIFKFFPKDVISNHVYTRFFLNISSYLLVLSLFTFLYSFLPNIKVRFKYAFISALFTSLIYQIIQLMYVSSQIGITKLNAIYGSFAALPLFLIWLQFSWMIFLFGAEINYAMQNLNKIKFKDLEQK